MTVDPDRLIDWIFRLWALAVGGAFLTDTFGHMLRKFAEFGLI